MKKYTAMYGQEFDLKEPGGLPIEPPTRMFRLIVAHDDRDAVSKADRAKPKGQEMYMVFEGDVIDGTNHQIIWDWINSKSA